MDACNNPRFHMWCRLIPDYLGMGQNDKLKAKKDFCGGCAVFSKFSPSEEDYRRAETKCMKTKSIASSMLRSKAVTCSLVGCIDLFQPAIPCAYNKKETAMDTTTIYDTEEEKRDYLRQRMYDLRSRMDYKAEKEFALVDDPAPTTPQEVLDRFKNGKVSFPTDEEFKGMQKYGCVKLINTIRWRDPAIKADGKGYEAAMDAYRATETPVFDAIAILDPKDALATVQAFEATLH